MLAKMSLKLWLPGLMGVLTLIGPAPVMAKTYEYVPKAGQGQTTGEFYGNATVFSKLTGTEVDIGYIEPYAGKRSKFFIRIINNSEQDQLVGLGNLSVTYDDKPVRIYSSDELQGIVAARAWWAGVAVSAIGAAAEGAAYDRTTIRARGKINGQKYSTSTTVYTPDYAAQADARKRTKNNLDNVNAARDSATAQIDDTMLAGEIIEPGKTQTVDFVIDRPRTITGAPLIVTLTVGSEVHQIRFDVTTYD